MDNQKNQVIDRLKQATNVLVTVSTNPSVDQLAGAIGLTLLLNKLGKHATTVFSGSVPSTIQFLEPEKAIEKTTDSLRDFIIALDKSKADKLRYKVEDQMVKIFITPYMTSISEKDLEFSQGDFNVDVIMAIGVGDQQDLDQAITAHGRILHDATMIGISTQEGASLGSINWTDPSASSLCEMLTQLGLALKGDILDNQMATALLTGIVAETNRFSNEKTSAETMQASARLMAAGANQQLVASQLQPPLAEATDDQAENLELPQFDETSGTHEVPEDAPQPSSDGTLQIDHEELKTLGLHADVTDQVEEPEAPEEPAEEPQEAPVAEQPPEQIHINEEGMLEPKDQETAGQSETESIIQAEDTPEPAADPSSSRLILDPPSLGGTLTANSNPEALDPPTDILGPLNNQGPLLSHGAPSSLSGSTAADETEEKEDETIPLPDVQSADMGPYAKLDTEPPETPSETVTTIEPSATVEPSPDPTPLPSLTDEQPQTLAELEQAVTEVPDPATTPADEPPSSGGGLDAARDAVSEAVNSTPPQILEPVQSLNAQPMDLNLGDIPAVNTSPASAFADTGLSQPVINPVPVDSTPSDPGLPPLVPYNDTPADNSQPPAPAAGSTDPNAPPPVPPPMMPPMSPPLGSDDPTVM